MLRFAFVPREYLGSACTVTLLMFSVLLLETLDFFVPVCVAQIIDLVMYPGVVIPGSPHQNLLDWSSCAAWKFLFVLFPYISITIFCPYFSLAFISPISIINKPFVLGILEIPKLYVWLKSQNLCASKVSILISHLKQRSSRNLITKLLMGWKNIFILNAPRS